MIDLVVTLVDDAAAPRFQEKAIETIAGIALPALVLGRSRARANVAAILAQLCVGRP